MRRVRLFVLGLIAALAPLPAAGGAVGPAAAANKHPKPVLVIRGGGFGHGVGMSQFGARGYALRGAGYRAILRHYYSSTGLGVIQGGWWVRVLMQNAVPVASFSGVSRVGDRDTDPDVTYQLVARGADLEMRNAAGRRLTQFTTPLRAHGPGTLRLGGMALNGQAGHSYHGDLWFTPSGTGGVDAVNEVELEDYVSGVIGSEMSPRWPLEALKAQAVAARSYAVTTGAGGDLFDQYPDTRSQVYGGVAAEQPRTLAAVRATRDQVVTYGGRAVTTYFFSTSGGLTENVERSFAGSAPKPWLRSVSDPYEAASPRHRWTMRMAPAAAGRRLAGLVKGRFRGIRVLRRGRSPRVITAQIVGTGGDTIVSGSTLRARLDLPDTWAYFAVVG